MRYLIWPIRSVLRLVIFFVITILGALVHILIIPFGPRPRRWLNRSWHRTMCRLFGLRVAQSGVVTDHRPCLYVGNHISYFDIVVLGSFMDGIFVAKNDIARWKFFGRLARLGNTLFISRNPRDAKEVSEQIRERLLNNERLILFPEGTSWDGSELKPFKSSPFSVVEDRELRDRVMIQPFSLAYVPREDAAKRAPTPYAYCRGKKLWWHICAMAARPGADVPAVCYKPVAAADFRSRKEAMEYAREVIEYGYFRSISLPVPKESESEFAGDLGGQEAWPAE